MVEWNAAVFEVSTRRLLRDLGISLVVLLTPVLNVVDGLAVSWPVVAVGVVVTGVAAGLAATSAGRRLDGWAEQFPDWSPLVAVVAAAIVSWVGIRLLDVPLDAVNSFLLGTTGTMLAIQVGRVLGRVVGGPSRAAG